jgi:hypothetical protein
MQCSFEERQSSLPTQKNGIPVRFIVSPDPPGSQNNVRNASNSSTAPEAFTEQYPAQRHFTPSVNLLHLELFQHFKNENFDLVSMSGASRRNIEKYALCSPFLMPQVLALSAKHLSISSPDRSQALQDEATKLQTEALEMFRSSVGEIDEGNIIPVFLYSGILGLHFFSDTFSKPSESLDVFLDRFVQSIKLMQGILAILKGRWDFLANSDIKEMLKQDQKRVEDDTALIEIDENVAQFEQLCSRFAASDINPAQSRVCIAAVRYLLSLLKSESGVPSSDGVWSPRLVTSWPVVVSAEFTELMIQRQPEALIVLAYYSTLMHRCKDFWIMGNGGRLLLDAVGTYLGIEWDPWLAWPRSVVYH